MTLGANADGKRSEKMEAEDSLRTVECLRGRLLAERVASRNAQEEVEQMEKKLIELEKKLIEESKSRNRAQKKLKFLRKKLQSLNISYESEHSGSASLEKSEISFIVSSVASSSTKEVEDKMIIANLTNIVMGDAKEFIHNSKSPSVPENLQQNVCSSSGNHDNPATGKPTCSSNGVNLPELTIQKEEIKGLRKSESPTASNNSEKNPSSSVKNHDNPVVGETISTTNDHNFPEFTTQKDEVEELEKKSESSSVSNYSVQNASASAKDHDNLAAGKAIGYSSGVNFPELTMKTEEIEEFKVKAESPIHSIKSEQNTSSSSKNHDNAAGEMGESAIDSIKSKQNTISSAKDYDDPAAGETIGYRNSVNFPELTMNKEEIVGFNVKTESAIDSIKSEQNASSLPKNHDNLVAGETNGCRNGVDFPELTMKKEEIHEFKAKTESQTISITSEQNACTINQCRGSPTTRLETFFHAEAHSAKSNQPQSSQKAKKDDHSLRTLFNKEKLNEDNEQEQDDQVDNSLALVPVDLPKTKQSIDPVILDATVKEVLGVLRNAKEKLQTSMERRRSNMIKVG